MITVENYAFLKENSVRLRDRDFKQELEFRQHPGRGFQY